MGKLTPEQLKQRRRNGFLKEITPEWVEYQKKEYVIDDEFDEAVKDLCDPTDVPKYFEAVINARKAKNALIVPTTKMWRPEYDPFPDKEAEG